MLTYQVFLQEDGSYGYSISYEGTVFILQTFAPGVGGFAPMTEAEATAYAQAQVAELTPTDEAQP